MSRILGLVPLGRRRLMAMLVALTLAATALAVSARTADATDPGPDAVYVATGQNYPDALSGSVLAAMNGAPVLLVAKDAIPDTTKAELQRLSPIGHIYVFGGSNAVSDAVVTDLAAYTSGGTTADVSRISGTDRYDTAAEVSKLVPSKAANADKLDGKDSSDFASSPLQTRQGPMGFVADDLIPTGVTLTHNSGELVVTPSSSGPQQLETDLNGPYDAGPVSSNILFGDQYLWGKLTGLAICYKVVDAGDSLDQVSISSMGTALWHSATGLGLNSTDPTCASIDLPTDKTLESSNPLILSVRYDNAATGSGHELYLYGIKARWAPYTFRPVLTGP